MEIQITALDGLLGVHNQTASELVRGNPYNFHSKFHEVCQNVYSKISDKLPNPSPWENLGYGVIKNLIRESDAIELSHEFNKHIESQKDGANNILRLPQELQEHILKLISHAFHSGLANFIEDHLGCYFRISNIECMRTQFSESQEVSFRWHRDIAPVAQIHVVIYLTHCQSDSPATVFSNLEDTRRVAELGYAFPSFTNRVSDINSWLPEDQLPIKPVRPVLCAGDATIFAAPRILHKGDIPAGGPYRDVILLPILPSLNPWNLELEILELEHLFISGRSTLWTNPFVLKVPPLDRNIIDEAVIPYWVKQSHYFPN